MNTRNLWALCALTVLCSSAWSASNWSLGSTVQASTQVGADKLNCNVRTATSGDLDINQTSGSVNPLHKANPGNLCRLEGSNAADGNAMVSAWSTTNQVSATVTNWEAAKLKGWSGSGFGVTNQDINSGDTGEGTQPEHAVDNSDRIDSVLYTFGQTTALSSLAIGYRSGDADIAVFRYVGNGTPPKLQNTKQGDLVAAGWQHVGNYADVQNNTPVCLAGKDVNNVCNAQHAASSWWLVTAYNPTYVNPTYTSSGSFEATTDHFKLLTVSGDLKIPAPGMLALAGLGLACFGFVRRRAAV